MRNESSPIMAWNDLSTRLSLWVSGWSASFSPVALMSKVRLDFESEDASRTPGVLAPSWTLHLRYTVQYITNECCSRVSLRLSGVSRAS
jgi:hypothetical protein